MANKIINAISSAKVPAWGNGKKFIAVHYLGVTGQNHDIASDGSGAHYYIYHDGTIYQRCSHDAIVWQVGTAGYYTQKHPEARNSNTIGIEMCVKKTNDKGKQNSPDDKDWYFTKETQEACVWLVQKLMKDLNIPAKNVLRHFDIVNKTCPAPYVHNNKYLTSWSWEEFKAKISGDYKEPELYRVRLSWEDKDSQLNAYEILENAKNGCPPGYSIYDSKGKCIYTNVANGTQYYQIKNLKTDAEKAEALLNIVKDIAPKYGILPSVIAAQSVLESGYCSTELSKYNNICGMKSSLLNDQWSGSSWDGVSEVLIKSPEEENGIVTKRDSYFRVYSCLEDCIKDICSFFTSLPKYVDAGIKNAKNYKEQITIEKNCGYATDSGYINKVCSIIEKYKLDKYDNKEVLPNTEAKKDLSNAEKLLEFCKEMDKLVKADNKEGNQWYYYNGKTCAKTFANARKNNKRYVSCANGVIWAIIGSGVANIARGAFYGRNGEIVWKDDTTKKEVLDKFELIHINGKKTVSKCVSDGTLKGACVVMFQDAVHTNLYINGYWFDAGHANCTGTGEGAKFKQFMSKSTPYGDMKVSYILRLKEKDEPQKTYRVQVGAYTYEKYANSYALEVYNKTGFSCFIENGSDGKYHVYCGSFTTKEKLNERVKALEAKKIKTEIKEK